MADKKSSFMKDFKAFISRGNVVDMAVGVVIGSAFGKIVTSFVNDIIMPAVGIILGKVNFSDLKIVLSEAVLDDAGNVVKAASSINYGNFIQMIIDFLIVALCVFAVLRVIMASKNKLEAKKIEEAAKAQAEADAKKKADDEAAAAKLAAEEAVKAEQLALMREIRDLLKKN